MKKTERFTKVTLVILALFSVAAVVLQILNSETSLFETLYEIIALAFAVIALVLAVVQGVYNTRTSNELHKIAQEINTVLKTERSNLQISNKLIDDIETKQKREL